MQETWVRSLGQEDPLERGMTTHLGVFPGESHGQGSLASYSPWGCKESDMTEQLTTATAYNILLMLLKYRTDVKNQYHTFKKSSWNYTFRF